MEKGRKILERVLELQKNEFFWKGLFENGVLIESRRTASQEYYKIQKDLAATYKNLKKGDKVLKIVLKMDKATAKKSLFTKGEDRVPNKYVIEELEVYQPVKTRTKKKQWVGDGYEDVEETTIKLTDGKYVYTDQFVMSSAYIVKI